MSTTPETYERFMDRCEIFFPHAVCVQISIIYALSKHYHRHDVRKDELDAEGRPLRYFEHPRRVALIFLVELALVDPELVMLALLHDAVEDTDLAPEAITLICGAEVSKRVMLVSKKPKEGFLQRLVDHADYKTLMVKVADRLDNLRSLTNSSLEFVRKQIAETRSHYYSLAATMIERTPDPHREKAVRLQRLLFEETERQAQRISAGAP